MSYAEDRVDAAIREAVAGKDVVIDSYRAENERLRGEVAAAEEDHADVKLRLEQIEYALPNGVNPVEWINEALALRALLSRAETVLRLARQYIPAKEFAAVHQQGAAVLREIAALGEPEAKCATCGGMGEIGWELCENIGDVGELRPCPECKRQPPRED